MKKKLISLFILITMILPMFFNFYKVEAFSVDLDPEYYIRLPFNILVEDGIGTGTISLSSSASGYDISYQKLDLTDTQFNNINNKNNERNKYVTDTNAIVGEKSANLETLRTEWNNLKESEIATTEQIEEAKTKYEDAYNEYQEYCNTVKTNVETLENEYYGMIPEYTSSWTETTNTEDNVQLDFTNQSGTVHFVLWVKITDGTNTYYDMNVYSSKIKTQEFVTISKTTANVKVGETLQLTATSSVDATITWESSDEDVATVGEDGIVTGIAEGTAVITAKGKEKTATCTVTVQQEKKVEGEWTDFSNAKFELKKDGISEAILEISNVTPKEGSDYYLLITSNGNEPTANDFEENGIIYNDLDFNEEKQIFVIKNMEKYIELNQDLYVSVLEELSYDIEKVVVYGEKLERFAEPKYSDAFNATFMAYSGTQIITTFTHDESNDRNIQIKVGKITDIEILRKIKNQDKSGFADLLAFAKSNNGIYNQKHAADKNHYTIAYDTDDDFIDLEGLQDEEYYFLYVEVYDDNGKYIGQEAVTLAQASVYENGNWYLFFYGDEDFEWADFGEVEPEDDTKAPVTLPNTGVGKYIAIISVLAIVVTVSYIQVKKMKEIR